MIIALGGPYPSIHRSAIGSPDFFLANLNKQLYNFSVLTQTQVPIEKEVDDLMKQIATVLTMIREGDGLMHIFFVEVFKLKQMLQDIAALKPDYQQSFQGTMNAIAINAIELTSAIMGEP